MPSLKLDAKDKALLRELERDARQSFTRIGKRIRASKELVAYRYHRLTQEGFITAIPAAVDYYRLGYRGYQLLFRMARLTKEIRTSMQEWLKDYPRLYSNAYVQSRYDLEVRIWVKDEEELTKFFRSFTKEYSKCIQEIDLSVITRINRYPHTYIHGGRGGLHQGMTDAITITERAGAVLTILHTNGREGLIEISSELDMPASTTKYQISKLKKDKVVIGYRPILDIGRLAYSRYRVAVDLADPSKIAGAVTWLSQHKQVIFVHELVGHFDISFEAHCKTIDELDDIMEQFQKVIPEVVDFDVMLPRT